MHLGRTGFGPGVVTGSSVSFGRSRTVHLVIAVSESVHVLKGRAQERSREKTQFGFHVGSHFFRISPMTKGKGV